MTIREILNLVLEAHQNKIFPLDKFMEEHKVHCTYEGVSERVVAHKYHIPMGNHCLVVHYGYSYIVLDLWVKRNGNWEYQDMIYYWDDAVKSPYCCNYI